MMTIPSRILASKRARARGDVFGGRAVDGGEARLEGVANSRHLIHREISFI